MDDRIKQLEDEADRLRLELVLSRPLFSRRQLVALVESLRSELSDARLEIEALEASLPSRDVRLAAMRAAAGTADARDRDALAEWVRCLYHDGQEVDNPGVDR